MGALSRSDVLHVAKLAKLSLSEEEIERFEKQLSEVIGYINQLSEVDTKSVEPTSQTTGLTNIKRNDEVKTEACLTQEEALSGADKIYNGYFVVPGILEERSEK